ncbi:methyl-accepting chemotaxis protein [Salinispirillum sp. LH 10-3-1]|uniref:Methyl-accepting chemotaxis protein n=1 Tax=Salinispirillum sp. LH 10-3-1 TaxID=2952525 RepID=A0AB38YH11_9GAMM
MKRLGLWLGAVSIRWQLAGGFGVILLLMVINAFISVTTVNFLMDENEEVNAVNDMGELMADATIADLNYLLTSDTRYLTSAQQSAERILSVAHQVMLLADNDTERELVQQVVSAVNAYQTTLGAFANADMNNGATVAALRLEAQGHSEAVRDFVDQYYQASLASMQAAEAQADVILIGSTLVSLVIGLSLATLITQSIVGPTQQLATLLNEVADGDLSQSITSERRDELGQLMRATETTIDNLRGLVRGLSDGIDQLASATEEMAVVSQQNSKVIVEQNTETEQVATAMNQMASTIQDVAKNAEEASEAAQACEATTRQGGERLRHSIELTRQLADEVEVSTRAIQELKEAGDRIGKVMDVINGIAEQTNLLALNAAIEAARAGDAGRGFSVVADEVRTLSARTQESTSEIETVVSELQKYAERGMQAMEKSSSLADSTREPSEQTKAAFNEIIEAVSHIQGMNTQIAAAVTQQGAVAEEVNRSVANINSAAEQAATASEETLQANNELARLGQDLQNMAAAFRLNNEPVKA